MFQITQSEQGKLGQHSNEFNKKEILKVLDNIYVAIGYGLANCIMIEGDDGIVIIDTMESTDTAKEVLDEFREITKKPIVGIVLTHFHADHTNGIEVFLEDCKDQENVEIITHESFPKYLGQVRQGVTFSEMI